MNGQAFLTLVGTLGFPNLIAAFISFFGVRASLRAAQPKTDAEAELARASANTQGLEAQGGIVVRLSAENKRLDAANTRQSKRLDELKARLESLEDKFNLVNDQNVALKRQNAILTEALDKAADWMTRYYEAGHPAGIEAPPLIRRFEG